MNRVRKLIAGFDKHIDRVDAKGGVIDSFGVSMEDYEVLLEADVLDEESKYKGITVTLPDFRAGKFLDGFLKDFGGEQ